MAEKEVNVDQPKQVEQEKIAETEASSYELVEAENGEGSALDEVDAADNVVPKRKKSGILGRLSSTRKKKKKPAKEEIAKEEPAKEETADEGKDDSKVELSDDKADEVEEKTTESEVKSDKPENEQQEEQTKEEVEVKQESEVAETNDSKPKKKPGRLRRLSFSKMKKSKKQSKKENKDEADMEGTENDDNEERNEENADSTNVQNVQEKCDLPEADSQSEHSNESHQPITVDIEIIKEKDLENENNRSYLSTVVHMPSDIAQKALQTIKQVFKPVIIYIIRKNPHCFKDIIESNKKTTKETHL